LNYHDRLGNVKRSALIGAALFAALAASAAGCAAKSERAVQRPIHAGSAARAKRPAEIRSELILPFVPGYSEYAGSTLPPDDPAALLLRSRVMAEYDRIILRVLNEKGFDLVSERPKSGADAPLPDITYHVMREAILEFDRSSNRPIRMRMLDEIIAREEMLWKLRDDARALAADVERLSAESASRLHEVSKLREAVAAHEASIRDLAEARAVADTELTKLRAERDSLKLALDGSTRNAGALQETIAQAEEKLRRAESRANILEAELTKLRVERDQLGGRMSEKLEAAQGAIQQLRAQASERDAALAAAGAECGRLKAERDAFEREAAERARRIGDLEREAAGRIERLRAEASKLQSTVGEIQALLKKFSETKPAPEEHAELLRRTDKATVRARLLKGQVEADPAVPPDLRDVVLQASEALEGFRKQAADLQP
jgi:hypothetical protein